MVPSGRLNDLSTPSTEQQLEVIQSHVDHGIIALPGQRGRVVLPSSQAEAWDCNARDSRDHRMRCKHLHSSRSLGVTECMRAP